MTFLSRTLSVRTAALAAALLLGAGAPCASAQLCFGPDGLELGPCCAPVVPNLPAFPGGSMGGLAACWNGCTPGAQLPLKLSWPTPANPACGEYVTQLLVNDATTGLPMLGGQLVLHYTRTWQEVAPSGAISQVWRFTAKADLAALSTATAALCPVPNCIAPLGPHPTAFYYGYMDYTSCAGAAAFEHALVLNHAPDRFIHTPGLSDKPGAFHPAQSYAIVGPHSPLQPFVPANNVAFGGPLVGEATRDVNVLGVPPNFCAVEDRVLQGVLTKLGAGCLATLAANPKQYTLRQFQAKTACPSPTGVNGGWTSLNVNFPVVPWLHMVTTSIGSWTNPNVYPGLETTWVDEGLFIHQTACSGDVLELKYGGTTKGGWTAILPFPTPVTVSHFTDIADNYTAPLAGPFPLPLVGSIRPTERLIYVNEP